MFVESKWVLSDTSDMGFFLVTRDMTISYSTLCNSPFYAKIPVSKEPKIYGLLSGHVYNQILREITVQRLLSCQNNPMIPSTTL